MKHFTGIEISKLVNRFKKDKMIIINNGIIQIDNAVQFRFHASDKIDNAFYPRSAEMSTVDVTDISIPMNFFTELFVLNKEQRNFINEMRFCGTDKDVRKNLSGLQVTDNIVGYTDGKCASWITLDKPSVKNFCIPDIALDLIAEIPEDESVSVLYGEDIQFKDRINIMINSDSMTIYINNINTRPVSIKQVIQVAGHLENLDIQKCLTDMKSNLTVKDDSVRINLGLKYEGNQFLNSFASGIIFMVYPHRETGEALTARTSYKNVYKALKYATGNVISGGSKSPHILELNFSGVKNKAKKLTSLDYKKRIAKLEREIANLKRENIILNVRNNYEIQTLT